MSFIAFPYTVGSLLQEPLGTFRIACTKGTYVRSIAHDLGQKLSCGAHLKTLRRTESGQFLVGGIVFLAVVIKTPTLPGEYFPGFGKLVLHCGFHEGGLELLASADAIPSAVRLSFQSLADSYQHIPAPTAPKPAWPVPPSQFERSQHMRRPPMPWS
jgi:hypothetical protein